MDGIKGILQSKTVWAAIISLVAYVLHAYNIADIDQDATVSSILQVVQVGGMIGAGVFRVTATKQLSFGGAK